MSPPRSPNLPTLVQQKFEAAKASSSIIFSHTELTTIHAAGIPFQLRYCPALSQKPVADNSDDSSEKPSSLPPAQKPDPFADPPAELVIAQIPETEPSHVLLLNKYPVIAQHFILATKAFERQTDLLGVGDLAVAFECLRAWKAGGDLAGAGSDAGATGRLFAFFNSGSHSGASQPHRHIQFLPVERMGDGVDAVGWNLLADRIAAGAQVARDDLSLHSLPQLPFVHFALTIPPDPSPKQLHVRYRCLYEAAVKSCRDYAERYPDENLVVEADSEGAAVISYNLALTTSAMVICPRRSEGALLGAGAHNGSKVLGPVAINGTILGGTLMVKTEEEWDEMRRDDSSLYNLLQAVGIPIENGPDNTNGRL